METIKRLVLIIVHCYNQGKFLNPNYIFFTNDDIHINKTDIIHKMLGHFHQDETIGAIGQKVIMPNGADQS